MYAIKQSQTIGYSIPKYFSEYTDKAIFDTNIENAKRCTEAIATDYCSLFDILKDNSVYYSVVRI